MKLCKWCGKAFEPNSKHKKYCCVECSKNGTEKNQRKYRIKNADEIRQKVAAKYIRKISHCEICGVELPHGSQKICLECLLKSYKGDDIEKYRHARNILYCRGYDTEMIEDECKERGII